MTSPALALNVRLGGGYHRFYPHPPRDLSHLYGKRKSIDYDAIVAEGVTPLPNITSISGVLDKPALIPWSGEEALMEALACACRVEGARAVHHHPCDCTHKRTGEPVKNCKDTANHCPRDCDDDDLAHYIGAHKAAALRKRDERADAGTRAHTLAERLTLDTPLPRSISEQDEQYADAFMAWWADHDPQVEWVEQTVAWIDPANPQVGYAGTADLFAHIKGYGGLHVVDWKTRSGSPDDDKIERYGLAYVENRLQLAALAQAQWRFVEDDGEWDTDVMPVVAGGMVVCLFEDGQYRTEHIPAESLTQAGAAFLGLLTMRRYQLGFDVAAEVMW